MIANPTRSLLLHAALALSLGLAGTAEARKPRDPDMTASLHHVTVNGASLAYLDVGKGEPIVLVHGAASDYRTWIADLAPLSAQCRVISYSRRYHFPNKGGGDGSDYSLAVHVRDLAGLVDALHLGRVRLIGHGYGAEIATRYASTHPDRVHSAVLVEPSFPDLMMESPREKDFTNERALWMEQMRMTLRDGFVDLALGHLIEWNFGPEGIEKTPRPLRFRMGENAEAVKMQYLTPVTDRRIGREEVAGIACPLLYVEGEKSPWRAHAMADAFVACRPATRRVTLKGATHGMLWQDPRDFSSVCLEFLGHDTIAGE